MYLCHSQTMDMAAMTFFFIEFPELQFHLDPMIDSMYITGTCCFHLYFFFSQRLCCSSFSSFIQYRYTLHSHSFTSGLFSSINSTITRFTTQVVPSFSSIGDPSEAADSPSSSSSTPDDGYTPVDPGMANEFLSSESIQRSLQPANYSVQCSLLLVFFDLRPWAQFLFSVLLEVTLDEMSFDDHIGMDLTSMCRFIFV